MTWSLRSTSARALVPVATVLSLLAVTAGPASAAKAPARTTISAHLTASTVLVKTTASITGTVTPAGGSLALQRLVNKTWTTVAHAKPSRTGAYVVSVRVPKTASTWSLKVVRAASSTAKAGSSATLKLHVVTQQFALAAVSPSAVTAPAASVVSGVVLPAVRGTVQVQRLVGKLWTKVATGKVGAGGAFAASTTLPVGVSQLRVVKPFTSTVAAGTSPAITVTVSAPAVLAPPTITTAALTAARVGAPYATLLTATGGSGFDSWSATGLPAGITLSAAGLLAGTPTTQGTAAIAVTVTDSAGHAASSTLGLIIAPPAGRLFGVGENTDGEIGNGDDTNASFFQAVQGMNHVVAAATGSYASIAVKTDGTVWTWGSNMQGQLGIGTTSAGSLVPVQVTSLTGVTAVAGSESDVYALKADGTVWAWGDNMDGEIGDGTGVNKLSPTQVSNLTGVVAISATQNNAYALKSDGTVWAWGYNINGEIGDGTTNNATSPKQVTGLTGIKAIASGSHNGYALRADGTVAAWGNNQAGELGDGGAETMSTHPVTVLNISQAVEISGGLNTAYARTAGGTVLGWGYNGSGQLAGATASSPSTAVTLPVGGGALEVVSGFESAYALLPDHTVVGWGMANSGQLGNGSFSVTSTATPTAAKGLTDVVTVIAGGFATTALFIAN